MSVVYGFDINRVMHIIKDNCSNGLSVNYTNILGKLYEKYPKIKRYHSKSFVEKTLEIICVNNYITTSKSTLEEFPNIQITDARKFYLISYKNKIKDWFFTNIIAILALIVSIISCFC